MRGVSSYDQRDRETVGLSPEGVGMNLIISLVKFIATIVVVYYLTVFTLAMIFLTASQGQ